MADAAGGSRRDERRGQRRVEEADESRDGVVAEELRRLRPLAQQGGLNKQQELEVAIREGRLEVVRYLVEECSADVNVKDNGGGTALIWAASAGHVDVVRYLVEECSADVNMKDNGVRTALMWAASVGHVDVVRYLVEECSADVNMKDNGGRTALTRAARAGHVDVVRYLVEECSADVNMKDNGVRTALMWAASAGHVDVVRYLVEECSADVNMKDNDGRTALMGAASVGHVDVVRYLVEECSADVNMKDNDGWTALMRAADVGHVDVVQYLVEECSADVNMKDNGGRTALMGAASVGHVDVVQYLVEECSADVNMKDNGGRTALMWAASAGHVDVVRYLVEECSADVNMKDNGGRTALTRAARAGHVDVVRYLVEECSADVNMKDNDGWTALMRAADVGHVDVVQYLVEECSADVNMKDNGGETALMGAASVGHVDVVRYLVEECSADVNMEDNDGWTALMRAADVGHVDVVQYLVEECSADVNMKDNGGRTALTRAARYGHVDVVRYLVEECSADVNMKDNGGRTALMEAARYGQMDVVRCLVEEGSADVNARDNGAQTALRRASDRGYNDIVRLLTPFAQPNHHSSTHSGDKLLASDMYHSIETPPSEVELGQFSEEGNIGGDFRVKWLGADAVAKLFIPDASASTLEQEVRAWQELRHPNVLKLYGVCQAAPNVNFFVCEFASRGSLAEYAAAASSSTSSELKPLTWKFLYEAALGLEYLHERGIMHGDLRCNNILIGNDGMAKLSNFGSTEVANHPRSVVRSMRWQAPEVLKGKPPSRESDVYSLGMCIFEAESGTRPWSTESEENTRFRKRQWNADAHANVPYGQDDWNNPSDEFGCFVRRDDPHFVRRSRELVWRMCCKDPHGRSSLTSIISELEQLSVAAHQPEAESASCFEGYKGEGAEEQWQKLRKCMDNGDNAQHGKLFSKLQHICDRLQESEHSYPLLDRFYSLVADLYQTVKMTSEEAWAMRLSCTRATSTSMISFTRRVDALLNALGESVRDETEQTSWQQQRREQGAAFVSGIADTVLLLQSLKSVEEQAALLKSLKSEMESVKDKYTDEQLQTMKETYEAIESKLATEGVADAATLTPKWFIPWYELILGEVFGGGGFGSVRRAKWLDSDVVVKQVLLPGSTRTDSSGGSYDSSYAAVDQKPTDPDTVAKRAEAQEMFRREADIWFGFSHPHVVRLFGACHIGRPFFVCEYATHGTLVSYLRQHPDELWTKLHEAALGVQYLHARDVAHGDLKGNNVVVGSDLKAKVTDFGLSLAVDSKATAPISGAWHWVAPECLVDKKGEQTGVKPTFESDVYSLGMCIVEALRVVEAVQDGKPSCGCLPWGMLDPFVVKYHVTSGKMPSQPSICTDEQWNLVTRMCVSDPNKRLRISTVVDELDRFVKTSRGSKTDNQVGHVTDAKLELKHPMKQGYVVSMTAAARERLSQVRGNTNQQDNSPVVLYESLWGRIQHVREQIDEGDRGSACSSAFHSLVVEAQTSTASLEATSGDLISLARVVMGCYALSRRLDKLCDAYFLTIPRELVFPSHSG